MDDTVRAASGVWTAEPNRVRRRFRLVPFVPFAILSVILLGATFAPFLTPHDPVKNDLINSLLPPAWVDGGSPEHLLGTDSFGRDIFARILYGARVSLSVAAFALVIAVTIGTIVGVVAGYVGGATDSFLMRIVDMLLALPSIIVALTLAVAVGPSFQNLILVLGLLTWPDIARLIRGETLVLRKLEFMRYSGAIGVPGWAILARHVIPNIVPTLLVATTLQVGNVILAEATLSFLGAGVPPPQASWGAMVSEGQALISTGWWIGLFAGIAVTLTVLAFNVLSDWLRDYLDPKTTGGR
jgi:peptide/nickel transport system permease protein